MILGVAARPVVSDLVARARDGDSGAFEALVSRKLDELFRIAMAILRNEADARDAVQEASIRAWRQLPGLREPDRFDGWFVAILVNECRTALRHRGRTTVRSIPMGDPTDREPGPVRDDERPFDDGIAMVDVIQRAFARLGADDRTVLVLQHVEGMSVEAIAAVFGIPVGTAKWRLHRARAALDRALVTEST